MNKYPFSYSQAYKILFPSLQTPTFKPANFRLHNSLIINYIQKSLYIMNNPYIIIIILHSFRCLFKRIKQMGQVIPSGPLFMANQWIL